MTASQPAGERDLAASATDPDTPDSDQWARLLRGSQGVAMHPGALNRLVSRTVELLHDAQRAEPLDVGAAAEAGALLVESHFTDSELLSRAIGLLSAGDGRAPSAELAGAFAAGWASALRERTLQEQEAIRLAADTARRDAERALRESEARFRALFESAAIGIGIGDVEGNILAANKALQQIFGARPEDMQGRRVNDLVHPEDTPGSGRPTRSWSAASASTSRSTSRTTARTARWSGRT